MTRLLLQLLLLLASCQAVAATTESGRGQRDMLRDGREELWHIGAAIIEDAQQPSRICNTRPQRVLPSIGFKPSRPSENGDRMRRILAKADADSNIDTLLSQIEGIEKAAMGPFRLEVCVSVDRHFLAVQPFGFSDFQYKPLADLLVIER